MCTIIVKPKGKAFTDIDASLEREKRSNSHGFGLMWVNDSNEIGIYKSLSFQEFLHMSKNITKKYGDKTPIVYHLRLASKGKKTIENCHPFKISPNTACAHNGTIWGYGNNEVSDTRDYLDKVVAEIGDDIVDNSALQALFKNSTTTYGKFVFLRTDRKTYISRPDLGEFKSGIWYSHKFYTSYTSHTYRSSTHSRVTYHNPKCDICGVVNKTRMYRIESIGSYKDIPSTKVCQQCLNLTKSMRKKIRKKP